MSTSEGIHGLAGEPYSATSRQPSGGSQQSPKAPSSRASSLLVLAAVATLALGGVLVRLSEIGPVATGAFRTLLAVPILLLIHRWNKHLHPADIDAAFGGKDYLLVILAGGFLAGDLSLWNISFSYTSLAEANLLANMVPFVVALANVSLYHIFPPRRVLLPAIVTCIGLYFLLLTGGNLEGSHLTGNILAMLTSIFYTAFLFTVKHLSDRYNATRLMAHLSMWTGLACGAIAMIRHEVLIPHSWRGWVVLIGLAITSQVLGQNLMAHGLKGTPLQVASTLIMLQPAFAALYALLIFGQRLTAWQLVGVTTIALGIAWARTILQKADKK